MIKAGIIGGETKAAGELVRILIFHPDVKLVWVSSAVVTGKLARYYAGMTGDTELAFVTSPEGQPEVDLVFLCADSSCEIPEGTKVVDLTRRSRGQQGVVYGLSEVNRKFMVHDCERTSVPHPFAMALLVPLLPLAKNGLLKGDVSVNFEIGSLARHLNDGDWTEEVKRVINALQPNFDAEINTQIENIDNPRALLATITMRLASDQHQLEMLYDDYFDDHNFVFRTTRPAGVADVSNTNKCLLCIDHTGDTLTLHSAIDALVKGCAGTAVHDMNLLFKLHERAGLNLKASVY